MLITVVVRRKISSAVDSGGKARWFVEVEVELFHERVRLGWRCFLWSGRFV